MACMTALWSFSSFLYVTVSQLTWRVTSLTFFKWTVMSTITRRMVKPTLNLFYLCLVGCQPAVRINLFVCVLFLCSGPKTIKIYQLDTQLCWVTRLHSKTLIPVSLNKCCPKWSKSKFACTKAGQLWMCDISRSYSDSQSFGHYLNWSTLWESIKMSGNQYIWRICLGMAQVNKLIQATGWQINASR